MIESVNPDELLRRAKSFDRLAWYVPDPILRKRFGELGERFAGHAASGRAEIRAA